MWCVGCRVSGVGCRVWGVQCRVSGVGCRVDVGGRDEAAGPGIEPGDQPALVRRPGFECHLFAPLQVEFWVQGFGFGIIWVQWDSRFRVSGLWGEEIVRGDLQPQTPSTKSKPPSPKAGERRNDARRPTRAGSWLNLRNPFT